MNRRERRNQRRSAERDARSALGTSRNGANRPAAGREGPTKDNRPIEPPGADWLPLPAILGSILMMFPAYFVAEASIQRQPHPLHWAIGVGGGAVGYLGGLVYIRFRGY